MLGLSEQTRVFLRPGVTDGRLSFEGLRALAVNVIRQDVLAGHLFVFCNRRHNRLRCLYWDGSGFWVAIKRLERATFDWPRTEQAVMEMSVPQLRLLLEGFELKSRRGWYRREEKLQAPKLEPELLATRTL
jgi:transposase